MADEKLQVSNAADGQKHRKIRSFVRREGRITAGQEHALNTHWGSLGLDYIQDTHDLVSIFGNKNPVVLEIGFGMGQSLVTMAKNAPETNFMGIEVHRPGVGSCLALAHAEGVSNLRVMSHDAVEVLEHMIPDASLERVQVYFPDPWHKKRHNKRRIIQSAFVALLARKIKANGCLHLATDWQEYAEHMLAVLQASPLYTNISDTHDWVARPDWRPETKFERRGQLRGHGVWDLIFTRNQHTQSEKILCDEGVS